MFNLLHRYHYKLNYKSYLRQTSHLNIFHHIRKQHEKIGNRSSLNMLKPKFTKPKNLNNDQFINCTTIDKNGKIKDIFKEYKKWDFLQNNGLYPRDLRKIDSSNIDIIPSISIKPGRCILVNLLHIKALIKYNEVIIFDTSENNINNMSSLLYQLEGRLNILNSVENPTKRNVTDSLPFELQVLEVILMHIMHLLDNQCKTLELSCGQVLKNLENQIDREELKDLLIKSKDLSTFYQRCLLIRNVIDELLDTDEDLEGMSLTLLNSKNINKVDMEKASGNNEMMLETYFYQFNELVQRLDTLITNIKSTEDIVNIMLDSNRNSLMLFELKVTIYTLAFTIATLIPSYYGMNLKNYIEESEYGFFGVMSVSCLMAYIITFFNFKALRSVTRMTLINNHSGKKTQKHITNAENIINKDLLKTEMFHNKIKDFLLTPFTYLKNFKQRNKKVIEEKRTINKLKQLDQEMNQRKLRGFHSKLKTNKSTDWFNKL
ncbi:related to Mitochondrial inner membrane magnesium transporter mrs2 [Hanseniaspora guilliermondii]|uniref:Magnesium transporter n=1 Tax=Hanseniaspora guilliermondii TaxID=56406 RepID=A0A1L0B713_9ASCO|nr:related to Mitochondrial inner membrane magnesium transporter mrs2 [Hanseniaspora guilliermondii]